MDLYKAALLLVAFICTGASSTDVEGYSKTENAVLGLPRLTKYKANNAAECLAKCNTVYSFQCKSFVYVESLQDCWPMSEDSKKVYPTQNYALYEKTTVRHLNCSVGDGSTYRGKVAVTRTGRTCQKWSAQRPHSHIYTPQNFPDSGLDENYCRKVSWGTFWCYTTDPNEEWEECDVPRCPEVPAPDYTKTERAVVYPVKSKFVNVNLAECKANCDLETSFICMSFIYFEDYNVCWTSELNSITGTVVHGSEHILYEKTRTVNSDSSLNPPAHVRHLTCYVGDGNAYRGKVAVTRNGRTCQKWSSQRPHSHSYTPRKYPFSGLDENYCRTADWTGPWCYTTDPNVEWEYCDVPRCPDIPVPVSSLYVPDVNCYTVSSTMYRGNVAVTESGRTCQKWSASTPHTPEYTPERYPDSGLDENYCRSPDSELSPWCYTTDPHKLRETCDVPKCVDSSVSGSVLTKNVAELTCSTGLGITYRGKVAITKSGRTCQKWSAKTPHNHNYNLENFGCSGLHKNYCRNPNSRLGPWCFTTDPAKPWEYCNIPKCENAPGEVTEDCMHCNGRDYRGNISRTQGGFTCQRWDSQTPHSHSAHAVYGDGFLDENYCRNPSRDPQPWCYTTDPSKRWDYCSIPRCTSKPRSFHRQTACITGHGEAYRGTISVTKNGNKCKRWSETPFTPEKYPCSELDNNFCRNVLGREAEPWCYINDTDWELCDVEHCVPWPSEGDSTEELWSDELCSDY